ncbi:MAG: signal peptidase II [Bryobacteraceae bacterium]
MPFNSAKGAARTTQQAGNCLAPRSVLRESLKRRFVPFLIAAAVVVLDRLSKHAIKAHLSAYDSITVIPGLFNIVHTENPGIAFGMLANASGAWRDVLLIGFSAAVLIAISVMLLRPSTQRDSLLRTALGLILGGAFGNLYDRIVNGTVTDFVEVHLAQHYFPAFNVADSAITVGACLLLLDMWWAKERRVSHVSQVNIER